MKRETSAELCHEQQNSDWERLEMELWGPSRRALSHLLPLFLLPNRSIIGIGLIGAWLWAWRCTIKLESTACTLSSVADNQWWGRRGNVCSSLIYPILNNYRITIMTGTGYFQCKLQDKYFEASFVLSLNHFKCL